MPQVKRKPPLIKVLISEESATDANPSPHVSGKRGRSLAGQTVGKRSCSSQTDTRSNSLWARLAYLWLLGSVAHMRPWSLRYRSGSSCLGKEQDSAEQDPKG